MDLTGSRFTIADAYLFTVLRWARAVKLNMEAFDHIGSVYDAGGSASCGGCRAESGRVELTERPESVALTLTRPKSVGP